ncbi:MAG: hypothetical protein ACPGYV_08830 [Phycisphaeraceae bacterium]
MPEHQRDQPKKKAFAIYLLMLPIVMFREQIEAALAILFVGIGLAIAIGAWHHFPNHWYWITVPAIGLLAVLAWPVFKFADRIEGRFDREPGTRQVEDQSR